MQNNANLRDEVMDIITSIIGNKFVGEEDICTHVGVNSLKELMVDQERLLRLKKDIIALFVPQDTIQLRRKSLYLFEKFKEKYLDEELSSYEDLQYTQALENWCENNGSSIYSQSTATAIKDLASISKNINSETNLGKRGAKRLITAG